MYKLTKVFPIFIAIILSISCSTVNTNISNNIELTKKVFLCDFDLREIVTNNRSLKLNDEFANSLQLYFLKAGFNVIDSYKYKLLLKENNYLSKTSNDIDNYENIIKIGKQTGSDYVVLCSGNYRIFWGYEYLNQCTIRMIDINTASIILITNWSGSGENLGKVSEIVGNDIYKELIKQKLNKQ